MLHVYFYGKINIRFEIDFNLVVELILLMLKIFKR